MEGKTYVLSDIHGNFEVFKKMLEKIKFNENANILLYISLNNNHNYSHS